MYHTKIVDKIKKHILRSVTFYFENHAVYETMWRNFVQPDRPQMGIQLMRVACWITTATNTRSEYIILTTFVR